MASALNIAAAASRELLKRRQARESLVAYSQAIEIPGAPVPDDPDEWLFTPIETQVAKHHILFLTEAQRCIEMPFGRLIVMAPPGAAKSIYMGAVTPTWAMGKWPGYKVIMTSYASPPAERASKRCQQIIRSDEYQGIFPAASMKRGHQGVKEWELANQSAMLAAGIMGGLTSSRCDLGIIDDPVAGRQEADSETVRRATKQAYDDDFLTRLKPDASIIIIMTRWHEDDLVGSILPDGYKGQSGDILCRDGQVWRVICLPAECERKDDPIGRKIGEMLWPEWFSDKHWAIFRRNARTWSALYQQRPAPESGGQFEKSDFKRYSETPKNLRWWLSSDFAVTELTIGEHPDFTEHTVCGVNNDADMYLDDGWSGQKAPDETTDRGLDLVKRFNVVEWLIEAGVIKRAMEGQMLRRMKERKVFTTIETMPSEQDKIAKVAAFRARAKAGKVWIKEGSWGNALIAQLCSFPFGRYDDKADTCGQLGRRIDDMYAPKDPDPIKRKRNVLPFSEAMILAQDMDDEDREEQIRRFKG